VIQEGARFVIRGRGRVFDAPGEASSSYRGIEDSAPATR